MNDRTAVTDDKPRSDARWGRIRDRLWQEFIDPPDAARPRAWWHWMDGNIDPEGIARDLRWLHDVGIRGAQVFDGGMGGALVVPEPVRPGTSEWSRAVETAVTTAAELGMELAVATSAGWSASGGPWVQPADAMKKVVWGEVVIDGGNPMSVTLPALPAVPGPYQDAPRWGHPGSPGYCSDWVVLAIPYDEDHDAHRPDHVTASATVGDWSCLTDGSFQDSLTLPRDPDGWSSAWIEQSFDHPVEVRSVVVGLPGPHGFGAAPSPSASLEASDDGITYTAVAVLSPTSVPARTASFAPVTARHFRLVLSGAGAADTFPALGEGVRLPPILRRADSFQITEFALRSAGRVHSAETKAGFAASDDYFRVDTPDSADSGAIDPATVIDITSSAASGVLRWDAPPGKWRILRLGASLTGQTNGPALPDSTGLEVDKLDRDRVAAYLDVHLAQYGVTTEPAAGRPSFTALLSDSIEAGPQNWTDRLLEHFADRRGYDPRSRLASLAGYVVGNADESDRFLYDYRRTIAELLATEYYGTLADAAHAHGMVYYAEALEDGRPQLGDDLAMRSHADVPMGAMWAFHPSEGPKPTFLADLKGASSVAHVHGKAWTGAEAFTSFGDPMSWSPQTLKHVADLQLSLGVTRFCVHSSPHQPLNAPPPGVTLATSLGQAFTINETWADVARPWIDYLARCSAMLSAGSPAVDIAVFIGEEAPVTGLFHNNPDRAVPDGFDFDYVGADALADILTVEGGRILSAGASYRLLYLGGSSRRMTIAALTQIERLIDAGATVVGERPASTPSLADDRREFEALCDRIWDSQRSTGRVIARSLADAITDLGLRPALEIVGPTVLRNSRVIDGRLVTFVANPADEEIEILLLVGAGRERLVGWEPAQISRIALPELARQSSDRRAFRARLAPFASLFILEDPVPVEDPEHRRVALEGDWQLQLPGAAQNSTSPDPRLWTESGTAGRAFSGTGVYSLEFTNTEPVRETVLLELGVVRDIARVVLNGTDCGIAWTSPFRVEASGALGPGMNRLEVHVTTPWRNRLISEARVPSGELFPGTTDVFEPTATPLPAGLAGRTFLLYPSAQARDGS